MFDFHLIHISKVIVFNSENYTGSERSANLSCKWQRFSICISSWACVLVTRDGHFLLGRKEELPSPNNPPEANKSLLLSPTPHHSHGLLLSLTKWFQSILWYKQSYSFLHWSLILLPASTKQEVVAMLTLLQIAIVSSSLSRSLWPLLEKWKHNKRKILFAKSHPPTSITAGKVAKS